MLIALLSACYVYLPLSSTLPSLLLINTIPRINTTYDLPTVKTIMGSALFFFFYIITSASSYAAFIAEHPYMWRQWWAAVLFDYFYVIQDYYCWWTIKDVSVLTFLLLLSDIFGGIEPIIIWLSLILT